MLLRGVVMENKRNKGSVTLEASMSMILFMFVMVTLLMFINISRTQAIIQNALNKSAMEIAEYTYLYYSTGIYELDQELQNTVGGKAKEAEKKLSNMAKSVDGMADGIEKAFSAIAGIGDDGEKLTVEGLKSSMDAALKNAGSATEKFDALKGQLGDIAENPMSFVKGLAAMGISYGMDAGKAFVVGSLLSRSICTKYLGAYTEKNKGGKRIGKYSEEYADKMLKRRGVVDGLSGLDFSNSSIFYKGHPTDINIVVIYEVKVMPLLGNFKVKFAQSASCSGWLGGDETADMINGS